MAQRGGYLHGLDYARALFAIAVVAWHTRALGTSSVFEAGEGRTPDAVSVVYLNGLLLAVPFFLAASLFLYVRSRERDPHVIGSRLRRLVVLAAFWIALWTMVRGIGQIGVGDAPEWLLAGGYSIFYFLIELVLLTALTELALRAGAARSWRLVALGLAATTALQLLRVPIADVAGAGVILPYWSPIAFLPYVFVALGVAHLVQRGLRPTTRQLLAAAAAYALLAALEWAFIPLGDTFAVDRISMPAYARPSLVLAAAMILWLCVARPWGDAPRGVRILSELSLAIYCIHPFLWRYFEDILPSVWPHVETRPALFFLAVMALTLALAFAVRRERVV